MTISCVGTSSSSGYLVSGSTGKGTKMSYLRISASTKHRLINEDDANKVQTFPLLL